jgi:hypothetical protein
MSSSNQWFVAYDGERAGPVDVQTLAGMIRSGRLPADVLVCREGMEDWLPASEVIVAKKKASQPTTVEKPDRSESSNKLAYALGAAVIVTLAGSVAYSAIQSRKHQQAINNQAKEHEGKITALKNTNKDPVKGSLEFATLQNENHRLKELESTFTGAQHHYVKTIRDLNASNIKYIADNRKLLNEHREATDRLAQLSKPGGEIDNRVKEANQRATLAEAAALAAKKKLVEITLQAEAQAALLQKQIDKNSASDVLKRQEMEQANKALADKLKSTSTQLTAASNQILSLKRQLGESPLKIGTPNGPKPPVTPDYFTVIGSTDDQFNFAVINKGSVDGVKVGDKFRVVSRESRETVAELTITRVQAMIAVGSPGTIGVGKLKAKDFVYRE